MYIYVKLLQVTSYSVYSVVLLKYGGCGAGGAVDDHQ